MLGWDYRDGAGNCPPGMYRVDAFHDCVPIQSPAVIQQGNLERVAAHYVDDNAATGGQSTNNASTGGGYQAPSFQMLAVGVQPIASGGGFDSTMMLVIGAVLVIFLMKR